MAVHPYTGTGSGGTPSVPAPVALDGQILWTRNGEILDNFGDTRITEEDYGNGLHAALAAVQPGDTILARGVTCRGIDFELNQPNVRVIFEDAWIKPSTHYRWLFRMPEVANDCIIEGVRIDGELFDNQGQSGSGFAVNGDRCVFRNIEASGLRSVLPTGGTAFSTNVAHDLFIDGYRSINTQYAGLLLADCNRVRAKNVYIEDPGRAVNIQGVASTQSVELIDFEGRMTMIPPAWKFPYSGVATSGNVDGSLGKLLLQNYRMVNEDVVAPGYSYRYDSFLQMFKCHNIKVVHFDNVMLWHGGVAKLTPPDPLVTGASAPSMNHPGLDEGLPVDEWIFNKCYFASNVWMSPQAHMQKLRMTECYIGARDIFHSGSGSQLNTQFCLTQLRCKDTVIEGSTFDCHTRRGIMSIAGMQAGDRLVLRDNRFLANQSGNPTVIAGLPQTADNTGVNALAGNIVNVNNTLENRGGGGFTISTDEKLELIGTTNHNGDMLFNDANIGTGPGKHPNPGAGPSYFSTMPVPANGKRIWNINWSPADTQIVPEKGWISHDGVWKEWT